MLLYMCLHTTIYVSSVPLDASSERSRACAAGTQFCSLLLALREQSTNTDTEAGGAVVSARGKGLAQTLAAAADGAPRLWRARLYIVL